MRPFLEARPSARVVAAGAIALFGCHGPSPEPASSAAAPVIEVAGCAGWIDGRTCEVGPDRTLRFWIGPTAGSVRLRAGDRLVSPTSERVVAGGASWVVAVPADTEAMALESADPTHAVFFRLPLADAPVFPTIVEAKRLRAEGKAADALKLLSGVEEMSGDERAAGHALRARVELSVGSVDAAVADFREAIARRDPRRASERVVDGVTLAFALNQRSHRFAEANAVLDEASARNGDFAEGRALVAYHRALVASETGDLRAALPELDDAAARADRLGDAPLVRAAGQARALALLALGRRREAIDLLVSLRRAPVDCNDADLAINLSWVWASCGEADTLALCGVSADDALREAERAASEAIAAFPATCPDPHLTANALVNGALVRLLRGDAAGALSLLQRSRETTESPSGAVELFWLDLESRALLAMGETARALAGFERERARAEALLSPAMVWRAEVGIARAREIAGDTGGALAAYARAANAAEEDSLAIPLGEGRVTFLAEREQATVRQVSLLLRAGRNEDALVVVRRARLGVLEPLQWARDLARLDSSARARWDDALGGYLQQRSQLEADAASEWSLPKNEWQRAADGRRAREAKLRQALDEALSDEAKARMPGQPSTLRAPESGETLLVYARVGDGDASDADGGGAGDGSTAWVGFARTATALTVRQLGRLDLHASSESLAESLLTPFAAEIDASKRVTVLSTGPLRDVDFHALPWRGAPLVARVSVAYGLDLPVGADDSDGPQEIASFGRALVVGDPTGDLLAARSEADTASETLQRAGWSVDTKITHDARGNAVRAALTGVELFHYAGHGIFAGADGWESALPLADSGDLSLSDLLALPRVPSVVVLAGCETGRSSDGKSAAGLGLAQGFLVAGAREVLASTRSIDDRSVERVMAMIYARSPASGRMDLVTSLAETQAALSGQTELDGWQDLRVLVR